ncbi:MAG TPA: YHS domain-containing protein [Bryobacteraceae bacterium]|nr:YHS domain-containing protein [Bryobacteraceae bacterium]
MHTDPVCKMQVEEKTAAGKSEYRGKEYYFCSDACKQSFDRDPSQYVRDQTRGSERH